MNETKNDRGSVKDSSPLVFILSPICWETLEFNNKKTEFILKIKEQMNWYHIYMYVYIRYHDVATIFDGFIQLLTKLEKV